MHRREAVKDMALYFGLALSASTIAALNNGCNRKKDESGNIIFTDDELSLVDEIAETIIPTTDTPGAKAAGVGAFIVMMINDCYEKDEQKRFIKGLRKINKLSTKKYNKAFLKLNKPEQTSLLSQLAKDSKEYNEKQLQLSTTQKDMRGKDAANTNIGEQDYEENYFYPIIHELTVLGYFTSEIGATQALAYVAVPGEYAPCKDLEPGQKAWML